MKMGSCSRRFSWLLFFFRRKFTDNFRWKRLNYALKKSILTKFRIWKYSNNHNKYFWTILQFNFSTSAKVLLFESFQFIFRNAKFTLEKLYLIGIFAKHLQSNKMAENYHLIYVQSSNAYNFSNLISNAMKHFMEFGLKHNHSQLWKVILDSNQNVLFKSFWII